MPWPRPSAITNAVIFPCRAWLLDAAASQRNQRDALYLRAAEAWRQEGDLDRADAVLQDISTRRLDADAPQRLALLQAEIALHRQQPEQALSLLDQAAPTLAQRYRPRLLELRARAAEASGNPLLAATARAELGAHCPRGTGHQRATSRPR